MLNSNILIAFSPLKISERKQNHNKQFYTDYHQLVSDIRTTSSQIRYMPTETETILLCLC